LFVWGSLLTLARHRQKASISTHRL
jgi:hypothetical protein